MVVEDVKMKSEKFVYITAATVADDKWHLKLNLAHLARRDGKIIKKFP